jgi:signal transduction histidine kinase
MSASDLFGLSPFPIVDLSSIGLPADGILVPLPDVCRRNFRRDRRCTQHYERLARSSGDETPTQCPFGFSSLLITGRGFAAALTSVVPFPRLGGEAERHLAKHYPEHRIAIDALRRASARLRSTSERLHSFESETIKKQSVALHELRKLNRSVKQTAERLCRADSPTDPEAADSQLVKIWKSADLMSHQFEVIELLANEELAALPLNAQTEIYKLFDKCVRIYRPSEEPRRLTISAPPSYSPRITACDKTLPIIPTVLIENALRYSLKGTEVSVSVRPAADGCLVEVSNFVAPNPALSEAVFNRGVRLSPDSEGSGHGLYLAQLVARQHRSELKLDVDRASGTKWRCVFSIVFKTIA